MFTCRVRKLEVVHQVGRAFRPLLPLQPSCGMGIGLVCTEEKVEKEHEAGTDGEAQSEVSGCGLQKHIRCPSFFG